MINNSGIGLKKRFLKFLTVFMTLITLLSSHGYAYYKHTCLITKKETVSQNLHTCFGNYKPEPDNYTKIKRSSCCKIEHLVNKVDTGGKFDVNLHFDVLFSQTHCTVFEFKTSESHLTECTGYHFYSDSSPPALKLFILNNSFLI